MPRFRAPAVAVLLMAVFLAACDFTNPDAITVNDATTATPYPSEILPDLPDELGEVLGCVGDINVILHGVTHPNPDDLDVLLEGPGGVTVVLMSDAGGSGPLTGVDLRFDDDSPAGLPDETQIAAGSYKPTNFGPGDSFAAPAPVGAPATTLSVFDGVATFANWKLYVVDDVASNAGTIAGGWTINITQCGQSVPAVVRLSTTWLLRSEISGGEPTTTFTYGTRPLVPIIGDWDGDGSETPGTFEKGVFKLSNTYGGPPEAPPYTFTFGDSRGFPVAGDFDGDGRDDVAVYRNGNWEVRMIDDGATSTITGFGTGNWPSIVPVAGDWEGDGIDGIGLYKAGNWTFRPAVGSPNDGSADTTVAFGPPSGGYPVVGQWIVLPGFPIPDGIGYKVGSTWTLDLCPDLCSTFTFDYGLPSDLPLSWRPSGPPTTTTIP